MTVVSNATCNMILTVAGGPDIDDPPPSAWTLISAPASGVTGDGRAITIARFESEAAVRANSNRAEQGAWWNETAKYYDGPVTFTESSDVQEFLGGGSDRARFVQVMKISGVDRAQMERLDEAVPQVAGLRPDLLGVVRIWAGPAACFDVNYFISEADARAGEAKAVPPDLQPLMAEFEEITRHPEFLDLADPQLD